MLTLLFRRLGRSAEPEVALKPGRSVASLVRRVKHALKEKIDRPTADFADPECSHTLARAPSPSTCGTSAAAIANVDRVLPLPHLSAAEISSSTFFSVNDDDQASSTTSDDNSAGRASPSPSTSTLPTPPPSPLPSVTAKEPTHSSVYYVKQCYLRSWATQPHVEQALPSHNTYRAALVYGLALIDAEEGYEQRLDANRALCADPQQEQDRFGRIGQRIHSLMDSYVYAICGRARCDSTTAPAAFLAKMQYTHRLSPRAAADDDASFVNLADVRQQLERPPVPLFRPWGFSERVKLNMITGEGVEENLRQYVLVDQAFAIVDNCDDSLDWAVSSEGEDEDEIIADVSLRVSLPTVRQLDIAKDDSPLATPPRDPAAWWALDEDDDEEAYFAAPPSFSE
ncbi:uncharacterized protein JCM10292_003579 [Rhodotorula paludigena]|uniref:uncharacterized protein n=1 Tax=Rhodotorula paludigena TaxID=86838 RepID=UPI00317436E8